VSQNTACPRLWKSQIGKTVFLKSLSDVESSKIQKVLTFEFMEVVR